MNSASVARTGKWLCLGGATLGGLGLVGWISGNRLLTTIVPGLPPMMPNTAMCLLLIGSAGAAREQRHIGVTKRTLSTLAALVVLAIGVGTLTEYGLGINLHIDHLLIGNQTIAPARPSPLTALGLSFLGGALLLFDARATARVRISEWLLLCAALTALVGLTGIVLETPPLYRLTRPSFVGLSLPTSVGLLLTSMGLLLERPTAGFMRVATSPGPGGMLFRRLALPAIMGPVLLGLLVERVSAAQGIEEATIRVTILASMMVVTGLFLLTVTAVPLNRTHEQLDASRAQTRNLVEKAPDGIFVADLDGRYTDVNDAGCRLLRCTREQIIGKTIVDLLPPEDVERLWRSKELMLKGGTHVAEWRLRRSDGSYLPAEVSATILPDGRWQGFVRDISERKRLAEEAARANQQLRESEERFRLALDEAPIGMALIALNGRFVRVNRALCEILGYTADELTGLTFQRITHPDDLNADLALVDQLYRGEIPRYQLEKRYIRKDGATVDVMLSRSILRGHSGDLYYIAQIEDITARKRLENELRLSEAKSTGILSISADAIICIDAHQHITLFNEGAEKIFGYSKTEAIGAPLDILIPERLRAIHRRHVAAFAESPGGARKVSTRDVPIVGLRKDGEEFPADAAISKLEVAGTRVLTVVLRDITEQKRVENEQRFLAEIGPALATTLDYDETLSRIAEIAARGLSDFCIVDLIDDKGEVHRMRVTNRDPSHTWITEVLQRVPLDQRRPHLVRSALESKRPVLMQRPSPEDLEAVPQNDDHLRALRAIELQSLMVVPLVAHGRLLGAISFLSVTPSRVFGPEELRVADELAQRAALAVDNARLYRSAQRASQMKDEVLGIVAHDLRNPLAAILVQAGLLGLRGPAPELGFRKSADAIRAAATRMSRLIQDLLDVTRLEAGQLTIEQTPLPAMQVVFDAFEIERVRASSAGLELRLDLSQELPEIWADRDRLLQVFDNLIGNAIKFTAQGDCISIGAAPREADVLFWVGDTGPGIPIEDQPHLFDRFWQGAKGRRSDAGLGLSIVRGIIDAHGGSVWVESAPGHGSTFFFTIPIAHDIEQMSAEPPPRSTILDVTQSGAPQDYTPRGIESPADQ